MKSSREESSKAAVGEWNAGEALGHLQLQRVVATAAITPEGVPPYTQTSASIGGSASAAVARKKRDARRVMGQRL